MHFRRWGVVACAAIKNGPQAAQNIREVDGAGLPNVENAVSDGQRNGDLITPQAKRNLRSLSGIGGVLSAT